MNDEKIRMKNNFHVEFKYPEKKVVERKLSNIIIIDLFTANVTVCTYKNQ